MLFARLMTRPESPVLWFFDVVTRPLTRPVRALLPAGVPEARVRAVSLAVYAALWIIVRVILAGLTGARPG
jgi:small-conductance mechanosensitive channel